MGKFSIKGFIALTVPINEYSMEEYEKTKGRSYNIVVMMFVQQGTRSPIILLNVGDYLGK